MFKFATKINNAYPMYGNFVLKYTQAISISIILTIFYSCQRESANEHVVREWLGKEMFIPDGITFRVQEDSISYNWQSADFKIVSFIDSTGCTGCKMKLPLWEETISQFNSSSNVSVALLMIVESDREGEIIQISRTSNFNWPLAIDANHLSSVSNSLPERSEYRTFLLDTDNYVLAIGNPVTNPEVMKLYQKIIFGESESVEEDKFAPIRYKNLGVLRPEETVSTDFEIVNPTEKTIIVECVSTSCDCTDARISLDSIASGQSCFLYVHHTPDYSESGEYDREIMVKLKDVSNPLIFRINGYIHNNYYN